MPGIAEKFEYGLNTVTFLKCENGLIIIHEDVPLGRGMRKYSGRASYLLFSMVQSNATKKHVKQRQQDTNC